MLSRRTVTRVAAALMVLFAAASARAGMMDLSPNSTVTDQINNLAAQAETAEGSSASSDVARPLMGGSAPLTKFSGNGRLTETLTTGGCLNSPISKTCTTCSSLTLTGTVNATGLGSSTLNICYTLDAMSSLGI